MYETSPPSRAAWIEMAELNPFAPPYPSPPSRAAWIEMPRFYCRAPQGVSPPSRAAWIEMLARKPCKGRGCVAAFTGGVD